MQSVFNQVGGARIAKTILLGRSGKCEQLWGTIHITLTGEAAVTLEIRAYSTSGLVTLGQDNIPRGTRLILTCDVKGLPESIVVISYKWYYSCTTGNCEVQRGDSYYTAVNDTLLVDTIWGGGRKHTCEVEYQSDLGRLGNMSGVTGVISLTG